VRIAVVFLLASMLGFAETWSGFLVDSKCYAAQERNVNPKDSQPHVDRDMAMQIQYCSPRAKTKSFAVVQDDWSSLKLDPEGNTKAAELVRQTRKRDFLRVVVSGQLNRRTVTVNSISVTR
jgi:hypothetical protein